MAKVLVQAMERCWYGEVVRTELPDGKVKVYDTHKLYDPEKMSEADCQFWIEESRVDDYDKVTQIKGAKGHVIHTRRGTMKRVGKPIVAEQIPLVVPDVPKKDEI